MLVRVLPVLLLFRVLLLLLDAVLVFVCGVVGITRLALTAGLALVTGLIGLAATAAACGLAGRDQVFSLLVGIDRIIQRATLTQSVGLDFNADTQVDAHAALVGIGFETTRLNLNSLRHQVVGGAQLVNAIVDRVLTHQGGPQVVVSNPTLDAN